MPPPLGQHVQKKSLSTDGDDGEDVKMPTFENDDNSFGDATHYFGEEASDDVTLSELGSRAVKDGKLTYHFVAKKATNLVCLAQTDQVKLGLLCNLLEQLASRIWNGHSIEVVSFDTAMPLDQENLGAAPVVGTLKAAPNTFNQ
jgi:hypothetical protein